MKSKTKNKSIHANEINKSLLKCYVKSTYKIYDIALKSSKSVYKLLKNKNLYKLNKG